MRPLLGSDQRFPPSRRLRTAADFKRVFDQPVKSSDRYFSVLARVNGQATPRLGLAISKRSIHKATQRNRLRRLARESFRRNQAGLGGMDFVVMARAEAGTADSKQIDRSLCRHWERLTRQWNTSCSP